MAHRGSPIAASGDENNIVFQTSGGVFDYPPDTVDWTIRDDGQSLVFLKEHAIRALFSEDYKQLNIQPWNANQPLYCFPRVIDIEFPQEIRFKYSKYKITLEADQMFGPSQDESPTEDIFSVDSGNMDIHQGFDFVSQYKLEDATETYEISMDTEIYGIFQCSHNVSAKGYRSLNSVGVVEREAYDNARDWVNSRTGFDPYYFQSGTFGITGGFTAYNHYKTQNTDINNGTYSVTETWILASSNFYEDYSAEVRQSINDPYKTVTVNGTINGLSNFQVGVDEWEAERTFDKYEAASGAWSQVSGYLYVRAQNQIGLALNPLPVTQLVTHNFIKGNITYSYELNTRPLNLVSGTLSETLNVVDTNPSGLATHIASHVILNRMHGPILQNINSSPETSRTISYECVLQAPQYGQANDIGTLMAMKPRNQVELLFSGLIPPTYQSGYLFLVQDDENWSPLTFRYSLNRKYVYERQH